MRPQLLAIALSLSLASMSFVSCHSGDDSTQASEDPATLACRDAGNRCGTVVGGCGADYIRVGSCLGDIPCCAVQLTCGERTCAGGNTCDTAAQNYCTGTTSSTPNCGSVACLGGCTCATVGDGCDCPPCQRQDAGPCNEFGGGVVYACFPGMDQQGNVIQPPDAGTCTPDPGGFLCCQY